MKWLTEYFSSEEMIVLRGRSRRWLFSDGANLREASDDLTKFQAMH